MSIPLETDPALLPDGMGNVPLFHPHIPRTASKLVGETLASRWIGQGPRVDEFEAALTQRFQRTTITTGSGTDALHLSYLLAGIAPGDEVIAPLFTCTATNIPLLYIGAKVVFADVEPMTLNIDPEDVRRKITPRTKAIVVVHYGGLPCDMDTLREIADEAGIPIIEDAAHALGASYKGTQVGSMSEFTMFSFQAIKHITTGDGGAISLRDPSLLEEAKRLRWFGIDRAAKQGGIWENDISEVGYKYQMTDIAASMGLAALPELNEILKLRRELFDRYKKNLTGSISIIGVPGDNVEHAAWLFTIRVTNRIRLMEQLRAKGIESGQVHYRNDRYSIFSDSRGDFPGMDAVENEYLVLPLHTKLNVSDVDKISEVVIEACREI